jgi:transcriptional regulator with PAS, ATPase and Fis domain
MEPIIKDLKKETQEERNRRMEEQDALWAICGELEQYYKEKENDTSLHTEVEMLERERISDALAKTEGNQSKAAKLLKIGRTNLIAKMKKYKFPSTSSR